jgi:membrane glycosyltransferase
VGPGEGIAIASCGTAWLVAAGARRLLDQRRNPTAAMAMTTATGTTTAMAMVAAWLRPPLLLWAAPTGAGLVFAGKLVDDSFTEVAGVGFRLDGQKVLVSAQKQSLPL